MTPDGPDVDAAARIAASDPSVKGMWIVPTYANPTGATCTQEVASRLVAMETAAPDFKILWDNAYAIHHLTEDETKSADVLSLASSAGNPHRAVLFASTSKVTWAGAGVAFLASSVEQVTWYLAHLGKGSIGPDKVNQLRHVEFFGDADGVRAHMVRHREILAPKFAEVDRLLPSAWAAAGWPPGTPPPAATTSTSTSCPAPPRASWSWPRGPGSRSRRRAPPSPTVRTLTTPTSDWPRRCRRWRS